MSKRNPIKSMSGNMWAALRELRAHVQPKIAPTGLFADGSKERTMLALSCRGLASHQSLGAEGSQFWISPLGRAVCDAFTEGQGSVR